MSLPAANTFSKEERLCGKTSVASLLSRGRWGSTEHLKYCFACREAEGPSRILVSVPKKLFKRAVRRNLLKRRIRESYRVRKSMLSGKPLDIMFVYNSPDIVDFRTISGEVAVILDRLSK